MWSQNPSFRFLNVYPKGHLHAYDHSSVYLRVANPKSLPIGWKRNVNFYFTALNHCNIERCRSNIVESKVLDAETSSWGFPKAFRRSQLKEKWFMGNDSLSIEVYINVIEAVDGESDDVSEKLRGSRYQRFSGFCFSVSWKNWVRIDWLKSKLENNFLERKKDDADGSRVQQREERVKNLEDVSLEKKKADDADGFRVQQFEESVKKLEMMVSVLKAKLDQEKGKTASDDFFVALTRQLDVTI
ncbi:BnaC04g52780D [Brassica napus]|uniref:BnaC04g52780D protein n=3 Tax=Brassica TaxID=3705 RepID=A0A078JAN6_BRANA|nr:BnaC04g52780D [Brassica napus]